MGANNINALLISLIRIFFGLESGKASNFEQATRYLISDALLLGGINISELPFGHGMVINSENFPEKSPSPHVNYPEREHWT